MVRQMVPSSCVGSAAQPQPVTINSPANSLISLFMSVVPALAILDDPLGMLVATPLQTACRLARTAFPTKNRRDFSEAVASGQRYGGQLLLRGNGTAANCGFGRYKLRP